ncbi:MAG: YitT family protein, partial [bacterium]
MEHPKTWKQRILWFLILNAGLIFTAAGIALFKTPNHFALGGTSGLAIIMASLFPRLNVGGAMLILNLILLLLGFIFLGNSFGLATAYASVALSGFVAVFEWLVPLEAPLTNDALLELIWAVILPAVGSAIVFQIGASTGGTDIVALILSKHTSLEIGMALLFSDALIVLATFWLYDAQTGLYC